MLAQLLIQFQKPIIIENSLQNATNQLTIERMERSVPNGAENGISQVSENLVIKERFIPPEFTENGKRLHKVL